MNQICLELWKACVFLMFLCLLFRKWWCNISSRLMLKYLGHPFKQYFLKIDLGINEHMAKFTTYFLDWQFDNFASGIRKPDVPGFQKVDLGPDFERSGFQLVQKLGGCQIVSLDPLIYRNIFPLYVKWSRLDHFKCCYSTVTCKVFIESTSTLLNQPQRKYKMV